MRRTIFWGLAVLLIGGMISGDRSIAAGRDALLRRQANPSTRSTEPVVTPVTGSSWLNRMGINYRDTSLGRGRDDTARARMNRRPSANRSRCRSSAPYS